MKDNLITAGLAHHPGRTAASVAVGVILVLLTVGLVRGMLLAVMVRAALVYGLGVKLELEAGYVVFVSGAGLLSGVGALYPALRAARQDAVKALSYE